MANSTAIGTPPMLNNQVTGPQMGLAGPSPQEYFQQQMDSNKMKNFGIKAGGFMKGLNNMGSWGAMAGDMISGLGSAVGNRYGDDFSDDQKAAQSAIRKGLAMIPGYGQLIAAATGAMDAIGTATGLNLSNVNQNSANRAGVGTAAKANDIINRLPGASMLLGGFGL